MHTHLAIEPIKNLLQNCEKSSVPPLSVFSTSRRRLALIKSRELTITRIQSFIVPSKEDLGSARKAAVLGSTTDAKSSLMVIAGVSVVPRGSVIPDDILDAASQSSSGFSRSSRYEV